MEHWMELWKWLMYPVDREDGFDGIERYSEGGFCPVHLGDVFDNGTYTIVHKLGRGGSSTVWLARDNRFVPESKDHPYRYVALKFQTAKESAEEEEQSILQHLQQARSRPTPNINDLSRFDGAIVHAIRTFTYESPNGVHTVFALPVMRKLSELLRLDFKVPSVPEYLYNIVRDLFGAVAYLHQNNVTHGDLHILNAGYFCTDLSDSEVRYLTRPEISPVVLWRYSSEPSSATSAFSKYKGRPEATSPLPDHVERGLPKYQVSNTAWEESYDVFERFRAKPKLCIADFGCAFRTDAPLSQRPLVCMPPCYVPPEYFFDTHQLSGTSGPVPKNAPTKGARPKRRYGDAFEVLGNVCQQVDVWTLGAAIYELFVGCTLLPSMLCFEGDKEKRYIKIDPVVPEEWARLSGVVLGIESRRKNPKKVNAKFWEKLNSNLCAIAKYHARGPESRNRWARMKAKDFQTLTNVLRDALRLDPRQRASAFDIYKRLAEASTQNPLSS